MEPSGKSILSYLFEHAYAQPDHRLLGCETRWLRAREALEVTKRTAAAFRRMGIGGGAYAALRALRTVSTALVLFGLRAAGGRAVLTDPRQDPLQALQESETPIPVQAVIEQTGETAFRVSWTNGKPAWEFDLSGLPEAEEYRMNENAQEPAFVIFTSGSTGKSKAVVLSESNLVNNRIDS